MLQEGRDGFRSEAASASAKTDREFNVTWEERRRATFVVMPGT